MGYSWVKWLEQSGYLGIQVVPWGFSRSSSRGWLEEGYQLFAVVYFSRGTIPQKRVRKGTTGGPGIVLLKIRIPLEASL